MDYFWTQLTIFAIFLVISLTIFAAKIFFKRKKEAKPEETWELKQVKEGKEVFHFFRLIKTIDGFQEHGIYISICFSPIRKENGSEYERVPGWVYIIDEIEQHHIHSQPYYDKDLCLKYALINATNVLRRKLNHEGEVLRNKSNVEQRD